MFYFIKNVFNLMFWLQRILQFLATHVFKFDIRIITEAYMLAAP